MWRRSVRSARLHLGETLTPTLRRHLEGAAARAYEEALIGMAADGVKPEDVPAACSYTLDQVLDDGFRPTNRFGIRD